MKNNGDLLAFLFSQDAQENKEDQDDSSGNVNIYHSIVNIHNNYSSFTNNSDADPWPTSRVISDKVSNLETEDDIYLNDSNLENKSKDGLWIIASLTQTRFRSITF